MLSTYRNHCLTLSTSTQKILLYTLKFWGQPSILTCLLITTKLLPFAIQEGRDIQYVKIHATWEVLTRYAESMKIRMPMKEVCNYYHTIKAVIFVAPFSNSIAICRQIRPKSCTHMQDCSCDVSRK